jgi:hypothetical protein
VAKGKNNDLLPTLGAVFCLFVVFLQCLGILGGSTWKLSMLLLPALWLLLGLCLLSRRANWLLVVAYMPLVLLKVQGIWQPLPLDSVYLFVTTLLCDVFPASAFALLWIFLLLRCLHICNGFRRELWFLPILLMLPLCVWQHQNTLPWAQLGMIASVSLWLKPAGK